MALGLTAIVALSGMWLDLAASAESEPGAVLTWAPGRVERVEPVEDEADEVLEHRIPQPSAPVPPAPPSSAASAVTAAIYEVRPGDSLYEIARLHAVPLDELVDHNELAEPFALMPGQILHIPVPAASDAPPSPPVSVDVAAIEASIEHWSRAHIVPADLVAAVLWQESRWDADAVSPKGAIGVGQLLPTTAQWVAGELVGRPLDPYDSDDNIQMSTRLLRWLIDRADGNQAAALAAYYQGWSSTSDDGWFEETERYVAEVFASRWRFRNTAAG